MAKESYHIYINKVYMVALSVVCSKKCRYVLIYYYVQYDFFYSFVYALWK